MEPAIVPTAPITDDVRTPPRAAAVVPQKTVSMTATRKNRSFASAGSNA